MIDKDGQSISYQLSTIIYIESEKIQKSDRTLLLITTKNFMKIYKITIIALFALFIIGCGAKGRTPTETLKALNEAAKNKDVAGVKKLLSKGSLELLEKAAKSQNQTSDELLSKEGGAPFAKATVVGDETIEGDLAYVTAKNEISGENERIPLVREDGEWKVALDKYLEDLMKKWTEQMKSVEQNSNVAPNMNIAPTNSNSNRTNSKTNTNQNSAANNEEFKSIQNRLRNN